MILSNLANVLRDAGLTVVEVDGWQNRGYLGRDLAEIRGIVWHHTVASRNSLATMDAPSLNICTYGRADVAGPLCQIVFGRSGTVYLTAAGLSNHAGAGSAAGVPVDMGNYYLIGIEMESSGVAPWDWTEDQIRIAPHLGAALERAYLSHLPEGARLQISHKEYSSEGKIDPAGWPGDMDGLRASINAVLTGGEAPAETVTPQSAPASAPAAVERPSGYAECIVDPGDTLSGIAAQFGVDLGALIAVNPQLANPDAIEVGQVLNLPSAPDVAPPVTQCIVDPGDTLSGIAAQFGVPLVQIIRANPGIDPDLIHPGQVLNLV
ncbi:LysM repeat protein [Arthrobacter sp. UYNi723]